MKQNRSQEAEAELTALRAQLKEAQGDLAMAYRQFDQALAPELVDSCIYRISAEKARCNYFIRAIKTYEAAEGGGAHGVE